MIRKMLLLSLTALFLVGCGRDDADPATAELSSADVESLSLFERIDADSIYVSANLQTMPDNLVDKVWQPMASLGELNRQTYDELADNVEGESNLAAALLREFGRIDSREALEERGLHSNGQWAIHAISIYPVAHWQLSDRAAFEGMLDRLAAESGSPLPRRGVDEAEIIWVDLGNFGLAIHHDDHFVTAGLVPDDNALLRRLSNLDQPTDSMDPRQLERFNRERGFTPYGSGYVDFVRLVDRLLDGDDELVAGGRQASPFRDIADDPACRAELSALVNLIPRLSAGLPQVDQREVTATARLETESGFGQKLARLVDTPVNLEAGSTELLSAGMALNLVAARDFGRELVGGWVNNPPQCALFGGIRENAEEWQLALNRPIPPIVTNIHGFRLDLSRLVMQSGNQVADASGTMAVFMRNPQMLVGMAQMFSPELAGLDLRAGGEPQRLPGGISPDLDRLDPWIALGSGAIGLAAGEDGKARLAAAVNPDAGDSGILFSYSINMAAYGELMAGLAEQADHGGMDASAMDFFGSFGDIYEETRVSVRLSERGIDFTSKSILKP